MTKTMYPQKDLYKQYIKHLIDSRFSSDIPNTTSRITLEHMQNAINLCESWNHCMDIGGGSGHYLTALVQFFTKGTLIEVDVHDEHKLLMKKYANIEIVQSLIENYKTDKKVDFILLADLFEHIPDIEPFVAKIASMQEYGGVVYIMTPNPIKCGPAPESGIYHTRHPNGHIKHYTTKEICTIMRQSGYTLIFKLYEEGYLRNKVKRIIFGLSRRHKTFSKYGFYRFLKPLILILIWSIISILGKIVYMSEKKHSNNQFSTATQDLAFKKVYVV